MLFVFLDNRPKEITFPNLQSKTITPQVNQIKSEFNQALLHAWPLL